MLYPSLGVSDRGAVQLLPQPAAMAQKVTTKSFYDLGKKELKTRTEVKFADSDCKVRPRCGAAAARSAAGRPPVPIRPRQACPGPSRAAAVLGGPALA